MQRVCVVVLIVGAAVAGCQSTSGRMPWQAPPPPPDLADDLGQTAAATGEGLRLAPSLRFKDIPVPANSEVDARTYIYESANLRIGRMVYKSKAHVNELATFFAKECPAAGWSPATAIQGGGAELVYQKGGELLKIVVKDGRRRREFEVNITPVSAS